MLEAALALASPRRLLAFSMLFLLIFVTTHATAWAAINPMELGARYDSTGANISFRVYSSRSLRRLWP